MEKIILASASPRRREILEKTGLAFTVYPSDGDENIDEKDPARMVERLSANKAEAVARKLELQQEEIKMVIGADTVVTFDNYVLGKPVDEQDAKDMLRMLQGNSHQVYTGVTILLREKNGWKPHTFSECTDVHFYPVTDEEIDAYVSTGEPMDKAGSYGIQGKFGIYVKGISGDYYNVVGFPVGRFVHELKMLGIRITEEKR